MTLLYFFTLHKFSLECIIVLVTKSDTAKEIGKVILLTIAATGLIAIAITAPGLGYVLKEINKRQYKKYKPHRINQSLKRLQKQQLITISEQNEKITLKLTEKGQQKVLMFSIENMKLKTGRWDNIWRIIIFDIPNIHKNARDALRRKMKQIGFYSLQESVLVTPWKCRDEVDFIKNLYGVKQYVTLIEAKTFDGDIGIKRYFNL